MNGMPQHTEHGLYADDTALWTASCQIKSLTLRLQQSVDTLESWCRSWKLQIQPAKTEMIHFSSHPKKKYKNPLSVKVNNTIITPTDTTRYLGVVIDNKLRWRQHLQHVENKTATRIGLLRYLSKQAKEPNNYTMIQLYVALVRSVMLYGYPSLLTANDKVWDRLQIVQNKAARATLNLPHYTSAEYIHKITKIPKIKNHAISLLSRAITTATNNQDTIFSTHLVNILTTI
jgi:Reverse transcriptase (RNA-dependent DNA polymerase)